jgi:hypothetical protein
MTSYDNPFYTYMKEQRLIAMTRAIKNRGTNTYAQTQLNNYLYYKIEMRNWRRRIRSGVVQNRFLEAKK